MAKKTKKKKAKKTIALAVASDEDLFQVPHFNSTPSKVKSDTEYRAVVVVARAVKEGFAQLKLDHEKGIEPIRQGLDHLYMRHRQAKEILEEEGQRCKALLEVYAASKVVKAVKAAERKALKAPTPEIAREIVETAAEKDHVPKVEGVSYRTTYEFEVTDAKKVPIEVGGVVVRPVKESTIGQLVRASKGQIKIPGVTCRTLKKSSIRG